MRAYNQPQPMLTIKNHRLVGENVEWRPTPHTFGRITPRLGVIHETGTRITKGAAVRYCIASKRTNPIRVGYHVIIERDGTIVQLAPFNVKLRHAGRSRWKGVEWANGYSAGLGLVGPTELKGNLRKAKAFWKVKDRTGAWSNRVFTADDGLSDASSPYHGKNHIWLKHTAEQMASLNEVVAAMQAAYPGMDFAGHWGVSPGRKIDPSPLVDIASLGAPPVPVQAPVLDLPLPLEQEPDALQELAHAVDQLETPPVAMAEPTDKTLKRESREYKATNVLEKCGAGVAGAATVKTAVDTFAPADASKSLEWLGMAKQGMDTVAAMVATYGIEILVVSGLGIYGICWLIKFWKRESYDAGLYEPSGADE